MWALVFTLFISAQAQQVTYSGFLGCRFARSVCQPDEDCINDALFGNCQKSQGPKDPFQYYLDPSALAALEKEIVQLLEAGYTWHDVYTQCKLGNILLAFRKGVSFDPYWCEKVAQNPEISNALTGETAAVLEKYFQDYYNGQMQDTMSEPEKKDQFVNVHKYFKAKREEEEEGDGPANTLDRVIAKLQPEDLDALQTYLEDMDAGPVSQEDFSDLPVVDYPEPDQTVGAPDLAEDSFDPESLEEEPEMPPSKKSDTNTGMLTMSPPDAKLLSDLLQERVSVSDLDEEQVKRLLQYVDAMLLDITNDEEAEDAESANDAATMEEAAAAQGLLPESASVLESGEQEASDLQVPPVKKEQMNAQVLDSPSGNAHVRVLSAPSLQVQPLHPTDKRITEDRPGDLDNPDPHDHSFDHPINSLADDGPKFEVVDANYAYVHTRPEITDALAAKGFVDVLEHELGLPTGTLDFVGLTDGDISFEVQPNPLGLNATGLANLAVAKGEEVKNVTNLTITNAGIGRETKVSVLDTAGPKYFVLTFVLCGSIAGVVLAVVALYIVKRHSHSKDKLKQLASTSHEGNEASKDYQDLCRQRMQGKTSDKPEPISATSRVASVTSEAAVHSPSSRSSTSSWSEEPVQSNMDISTGHIVLSYMEDHLKNKDRLDEEWESLVAYEPDLNATTAGSEASNMRKNRYTDIIPYDHSRVVLSSSTNVSGSDFINGSTITDHDPRNPAYITTQGPLPHTVADFWQMVWEQGSVVIVMLTKLTENGVAMCHRYWPEEGSDLYHIYEVHLVSEHIWCDDYLVRSFYLKNLQTNETRTVTQFHFLTWPDLGIPASTKALLDFRRKVNKSYRGRSCPITIHCSDGVGRTGTYCLIDMVLNRLSKGAKEIDIAATLEHIRDQRMNMVKTKEQFEFALAAVAEEVHAILKALPQ